MNPFKRYKRNKEHIPVTAESLETELRQYAIRLEEIEQMTIRLIEAYHSGEINSGSYNLESDSLGIETEAIIRRRNEVLKRRDALGARLARSALRDDTDPTDE